MKVLLVGNSNTVKGGINSVIVSLIEGLKRSKEELIIERYPSYTNRSNSLARIVYSIVMILKFPFYAWTFDVIHLHSAAKGSFYRKAIYTIVSKLLRKKIVFHIHASGFEAFQKSNHFNSWVVKNTLNKADCIIVLSDQMRKLVRSYCQNQKIVVLPNPINIPKDSEIEKLKEPNQKIQLLFMGEIGKRKGIYDLVDAISQLPNEARQRVVLHICGNNEIDKLKEYIISKQLTGSCIVHGWIDGVQKNKFLSNADVYILPSYAEGLPISILEAMAYGMPIISTNVGGIPEIVKNNENGFLLEPGDTVSLAIAIEKLINDNQLRLRYGLKSKENAKKHDLQIVIEKLLTVYKAS
ncbi:glycosyltransferase family 4 protein [Paenibacillus thailandensis]|uniref:Glycosyltransferase family 4 protein n=1 Tax=Paenibacillus thailandensis TaxID=393250 RepID=A0ABW5R347_9BACL